MADNTVLNPVGVGSAGDTIRDVARQGGSVKTQVVQLDLGGPSANAEALVTIGSQPAAMSIPVAFAGDQKVHGVDQLQASMAMAAMTVSVSQSNGFVPIEIPFFLSGV